MSASSRTTTNHDEIRKWVEERDGKPATVKGTGNNNDAGILRIDFPDGREGSLEPISWDEFFKKFDDNDLEFLYQEKTADGATSRFNKFVSRGSSNDR